MAAQPASANVLVYKEFVKNNLTVRQFAVHLSSERKVPNTMLMQENRTKRLEARVTPEIHELLSRAASIQGGTITDFVVAAVRAAAERAISQYQVIQLSADDQVRFAEALLNPPPVAPALEKAAKLHRQLESS